MNSQRPLLTLILILGIWLSLSQSLRFDLKSGQSKCIAEELEKNAISAGTYHVVNPHEDITTPLPESHKLDVWVMSNDMKKYHNVENAESGEFRFTATERGSYMTCFGAAKHTPTLTLTVDFDWKTAVAATTSNMGDIVTKGSIYGVELELRRMMDTVKLIAKEMSYLRERRLEMQEMTESTNSKMFLLGLLSVFTCLFVAGLEVRHLSNYLKKKKLI